MMTRRKTRSSSRYEDEKSEPIPFDLIIEILTKLPVKSIARFRCIEKLWYIVLRSPNFTESFFTLSSSHPKLLFACLKDGETFFFTSAQPENSSTLTASFHMKFPINCPFDICQPVRGLICGKNQRTVKGEIVTVPLICNPSTGESLALPKVKSSRKRVITYFGYDPVDKQFKVLCMSYCELINYFEEHQVLTLGTGKEPSWRMIKCDIPHFPLSDVTSSRIYHVSNNVCIDGVLNYMAWICKCDGDWSIHIVCFDIRTEKFRCIRRTYGMQKNFGAELKRTLVNYKGKLATLQPNIVDHICTGIELWVLEDAEKHEWSSYIYIFPKNVVRETQLRFVGMTSTGEIVLSPKYTDGSFYLICYNPEKNNITRVKIQGMEEEYNYFNKVYTFLDHVENVIHMASVWDRGHLT